MIQFQQVSVTYPSGVCALSEVQLEIHKGEFIFLVGPSGQGKSTALKLIYRDEKPSVGNVLVEGHDVGRLGANGVARLRRRMGVVFQDFSLLEYKTVRENLKFAMQVVDTPPFIIRKRVNELLEQVGLIDRNKAFPQQISSGEQQRLCIARALINHPPILLADEPTGNLDPETSWEIVKLLEAINLKGTTVVMATHDRDIVEKSKKRVVNICNGRIVSDIQEGGYYPPVEECVKGEE